MKFCLLYTIVYFIRIHYYSFLNQTTTHSALSQKPYTFTRIHTTKNKVIIFLGEKWQIFFKWHSHNIYTYTYIYILYIVYAVMYSILYQSVKICHLQCTRMVLHVLHVIALMLSVIWQSTCLISCMCWIHIYIYIDKILVKDWVFFVFGF